MDPRALAIGSLRSAGWAFTPASADALPDSAAFRDAHCSVAPWVSSFSELSSADGATWFLSAGDYASTTTDGFAWNEFETISLDAASTADERAAIDAFWNEHLPILLSVRGRYAYLAVRHDGVVVHGEEPEFEQTRIIASDLGALLEMIARSPRSVTEPIESLLFDTGQS